MANGKRAEAEVTGAEEITLISATAVAAGDTKNLNVGGKVCRGLVVGNDGRIQGTMRNGTTFNVFFKQAVIFPAYFATITESTATDIQALY